MSILRKTEKSFSPIYYNLLLEQLSKKKKTFWMKISPRLSLCGIDYMHNRCHVTGEKRKQVELITPKTYKEKMKNYLFLSQGPHHHRAKWATRITKYIVHYAMPFPTLFL